MQHFETNVVPMQDPWRLFQRWSQNNSSKAVFGSTFPGLPTIKSRRSELLMPGHEKNVPRHFHSMFLDRLLIAPAFEAAHSSSIL